MIAPPRGRGSRRLHGHNQRQQCIEALIEDAMERGTFENLQGKGKPLNLDAYFETPEDVRVGYSLLKSAGFLPGELELRAEINLLEEKRRATAEESERRALRMGHPSQVPRT